MNEQRKTVRYARILKAAGSQTDFGVGWLVRIVNISQGGVGLHVGERLEEGIILTLKVSRPQQKSMRRHAKVVHVTQQDNGTWIVGTEWLQPLSDEELRGLME